MGCGVLMSKALLQTVPLFSAFNCCHLLLTLKKKKRRWYIRMFHYVLYWGEQESVIRSKYSPLDFLNCPQESDIFGEYQLQCAVAYQRMHGSLSNLLVFLWCEIYIQNIVLSLGKKGRGWGRSPARKNYYLYLQFARGFLFVWFGFSMN